MTNDGRHLEPRTALLVAVGLFTTGVGAHLAFAAAGRRAVPITFFAFGPPIAVLAYLRVRPAADQRRLAGLLLWGVVATGVAFLAVFVVVENYSYLPRERSNYELFRFDLDLYLWFVLALAGTYTAAARVGGRRALAALAAAPLVQVVVPVALVFLERWLADGTGF